MGWWGGGVVACRIILSAPVPFLFLWTLDFGFWTWILDLGFGLGFWTWILDLDLGLGIGLGLDNNHSSLKILKSFFKNINLNTQEMPVILSVVNGPSSEIKGSEEDDQQDHVLKRFSLIWCTNHGAAQDKREPVEDNAHGEELVAEVGQE